MYDYAMSRRNALATIERVADLLADDGAMPRDLRDACVTIGAESAGVTPEEIKTDGEALLAAAWSGLQYLTGAIERRR